MLHLEKNEIVSDLKKIIKEAGNHPEIQEKCKEALEKCNEYGNGGVIDVDKVLESNKVNSNSVQSFKEFIKSNPLIVDSFIFTLHKKKNCPALVIDYICTFLANSLLHKNALKELSGILNQKTTWSEHEKMKILQMSFYLVRSEDFNEEMAEDLFNYLLGLIDDPNKQIMNTAKPITIQIIDYLMNKCIKNYGKEDGSKDLDKDLLKPNIDLPLINNNDIKNETSNNDTLNNDTLNNNTLNNNTLNNDTLNNNTLNNNTLNNETLNNNTLNNNSLISFNKNALQICINILQTNFSKRNISKNLSLFYADVLMLVVQKKEIFTIPKFQDFFSSEIFPDIKTKLQEGSKEEKEKFIELLSLICEEDNFNYEIQNLLQNLIQICKEKDFQFILPLLLNLNFKKLSPHVEGFLFNLLEFYEMNSEIQRDVIWRLSEFVRKNVRKGEDFDKKGNIEWKQGDYEQVNIDYDDKCNMDFKDLKEVEQENMMIYKEDTIDKNNMMIYKDGVIEQENMDSLNDNNPLHQNAVYLKYASKLIKIFESSKKIDFRLLNSALEFSLQMENLDLFESIVKIFMRINKEEILLVECIKHRSLMKDSWEIVFEHIRLNNIILNNLNSFNDEQIFFLTKSLTSNPTRWPLPETLSFYKSVFQGSTPTLKNPINIKILDLYGSSLLSLLNQNQTQKLLILNLYCEIILDYIGNLESSSILVQDTIGEMLRKALVLNVTTFGPLILQTLQTFLRLSIPDNWDKFFLVIEMCSISPLHSDLFQVLILIIEKYLDLLSPNDFLILLSCIEDLIQGEEDLSNKAMMSMLEIGECLISIRVLNKQIEFYEVWKSYLIILYEFTKDHNLRDKSLRNLFRFINSDSVLLSPLESEFLFKKILIPLINETKEEIENESNKGDSSNMVDIKGDINLTKNNPSSFIFTLLDELSKHDPLKFNNISYLESQLDLIKSILNLNFINLDLISKCITPLSIRIQPPSISILILNSKSNSSKIHFENSIPYDLVNETIFKFYKNLIEEYDKYPPKCFLLLLEDLKRFEKGKIKENIKMFDKILLGEEEVVKKVIEVILTDEGGNVNKGNVNKGNNEGNVRDEDVLNGTPLNTPLPNDTNLPNNTPLPNNTTLPNNTPSLNTLSLISTPHHSSFILNYLLDFMTKSPFLASLLMKESKKSLSSKTICKFLKKIREVLDLYEFLWEECLEITQEVSGLVKREEEFKEFVELSREIFLKGMEIKDDEDKGDSKGKDKGNIKENNIFNNFQIYNNKQFSHYLEHDPLKTKILKDTDLKKTLSISKTLEYRRKERLLLKYLIIYYTKISKRGNPKEDLVKLREEQGKDLSKFPSTSQDRAISNLPSPLTNTTPLNNTPFSVVLSLTQIKNSKPFNFYNLAFKSYHLLFLNINQVFDELLLILKKTLKNYNEEEKLNNMLFSTIKQKEIYLVFELLIETRNKKLIENLKIEMLNCLKNKDLNVVEYVRKSLMVIFE